MSRRDINRPPTPDTAGEAPSASLEDRIRYQLHATGERERLKLLLANKLEASGWREEVKERCKEFAAKQGRDVSIEDIVKAVRPQGRALVPDSVKVGMNTHACEQAHQGCFMRAH